MNKITITVDNTNGIEMLRFIIDGQHEIYMPMEGHTKYKRLLWILKCLKKEIVRRNYN